MKKILWLSNIDFSKSIESTGTWIYAAAEAIINTGEIKLYNISFGNVDKPVRRDAGKIIQWLVPREKTNLKGLPSKNTIGYIKQIQNEVSPDLIHIWGTESYWGMLAIYKVLKDPILLEMQGILCTIEKVYYGGLTWREIIHSIGIKELLLPHRHIYFKKRKFRRKEKFEKKVIKYVSNISVQSEWVKNHILIENKDCNIFRSKILLRKEFCEAKAWTYNKNPTLSVFTSSSGSVPYKGIHVLFRAIAILKEKHCDIKLRIAGNYINKSLIKVDGYTRWLLKEAKKLGVANNIEWLGPLNAGEIVQHLRNSNVVVIPSFVESYCLAFAEAMMVGVPTVASYSSALTELAVHNDSALFFPIGDPVACSYQISRILENKTLALQLSQNARELAKARNTSSVFAKNQLDIYRTILMK